VNAPKGKKRFILNQSKNNCVIQNGVAVERINKNIQASKSKRTLIDGEIYHVHGSEESI